MQRAQIQNSDVATGLRSISFNVRECLPTDPKLLRDAVVELTQLPPFGSKFHLHVAR